jgi:hypothetical protein
MNDPTNKYARLFSFASAMLLPIAIGLQSTPAQARLSNEAIKQTSISEHNDRLSQSVWLSR